MSFNTIKSTSKNYPPFRLTQVLGDGATSPEYVAREDVITSLSLSNDGKLLFSGDAGGRVSVFKRDTPKNPWKTTRHGEKLPDLSFSFMCDAVCHEPSFDSLKGKELSPSIISLGVVREVRNSMLLYTACSERVSLWRVTKKPINISSDFGGDDNNNDTTEENNTIQFVSSFGRLHKGLLIGACSNYRGTHLVCSDDENISLLWDVEYSDKTSAVLIRGRKSSLHHRQTCMKLNKYRETKDVIVGYEDGVSVLSDWRCNQNTGIEFSLNDGKSSIIFDSSVLGVEYGIHDTNLVITRNAATIGFFDIRNNKSSQTTINSKLVDFNPYIRHKLSSIKNSSHYNSDAFDICTMNDGRVLTGSYDSVFLAFEDDENASLVNVDSAHLRSGRGDKRRVSKFVSECPGNMRLLSEGDYIRSNIKAECDIGKKILHLSCSQDKLMDSLPTFKSTTEPFIVAASHLGTLYIYGQYPQKDCEED